jgi:hypothetical protein
MLGNGEAEAETKGMEEVMDEMIEANCTKGDADLDIDQTADVQQGQQTTKDKGDSKPPTTKPGPANTFMSGSQQFVIASRPKKIWGIP